MIYRPGDSASTEFTTTDSTGAAADAASTPTAVLARNAVDDGTVTVTVAKIDTGRYKATWTIPSTYAAGDALVLMVTASITGLVNPAKKKVWETHLEPFNPFTPGTVNDVSPTTAGFTPSLANGANYTNMAIVFGPGTANAGLTNEITGFSGGKWQFYKAWPTAPANGDAFIVIGFVK